MRLVLSRRQVPGVGGASPSRPTGNDQTVECRRLVGSEVPAAGEEQSSFLGLSSRWSDAGDGGGIRQSPVVGCGNGQGVSGGARRWERGGGGVFTRWLGPGGWGTRGRDGPRQSDLGSPEGELVPPGDARDEGSSRGSKVRRTSSPVSHSPRTANSWAGAGLNVLYLWDVGTGKVVAHLKGSTAPHGCGFSPGGTWLITGNAGLCLLEDLTDQKLAAATADLGKCGVMKRWQGEFHCELNDTARDQDVARLKAIPRLASVRWPAGKGLSGQALARLQDSSVVAAPHSEACKRYHRRRPRFDSWDFTLGDALPGVLRQRDRCGGGPLDPVEPTVRSRP